MANGAVSIAPTRYGFLYGVAVAILVHALFAAMMASLSVVRLRGQLDRPVEVDVVAAKAPEPPPPPPLPEPPPEAPPKVVARKAVPRPAAKAPPVPNRETPPPKPTDEPVKPVFGVTEDSVVEGESDVMVAVGNTLMTKDRTLAKAPPPPLPAAPPPPRQLEFSPVDEESVAVWPTTVVEPKAEYPEMALRMGIGGRVQVKVGIDRHGNVKSVRLLEKAGYGMDEAAVKAMWKYKFSPAKLSNGQAVDIVISYAIRFQPRGGP